MAFQQNSKNQPQKSGELNLAKRVSKIEFVSRPLAITTPQIMKDGCQDCLRVNDGLHHAVIVSVRKGKKKYIIENVKDKDDCYGCCQCSIFDETNTNYLLERQIVEEDLTQYITVENLYKEGKGKSIKYSLFRNNCIDAKNRIKQYINKLLNPGVPQIELTKLSYIQSLVSAIQGSFLSGKIAIMLVNGELMEQVSMVADNEINDRNLKIATFLNIIIIQTYSFFLYLGYISAEVNNQDLTFESFLLIITFQIVQIILEFLFMNTMENNILQVSYQLQLFSIQQFHFAKETVKEKNI